MKKAFERVEKNLKLEWLPEKQLIVDSIEKYFPQSKAILLKGSRGMKMEDIIKG